MEEFLILLYLRAKNSSFFPSPGVMIPVKSKTAFSLHVSLLIFIQEVGLDNL